MMSIQKLMFVIGLSLLFAGCSTSGGYLNDNINNGGPTKMGMRYLLGRGVQQDDKKAFSYFLQGAKQDNPFAENELGYLYAAGRGTPRDYTKSLFWYEKAAKHGLASAQYNLGLLYLHGMGTPPNKAVAMEWFKKSANYGFEPARTALQSQS